MMLDICYEGMEAEIQNELTDEELMDPDIMLGYHLKDTHGEYYNFYKKLMKRFWILLLCKRQ